MQNSQDVLVDVQDLQVYFYLHEGVVRAVDGVSFTIHQGRILGVIGESGSGKSVTAQSIMGIVPSPPAKQIGGKITLHVPNNGAGYRVVNLSELPLTGSEFRSIRGKEIGMIFQEPMTSFSPVHTIGDQIMEAILVHIPGVTKKEARERTIELLRRVGIPRAESRVDAYPHQFSGGMRQRAMIALALACNPKVLIADEPTTALDVTIQAQIIELMQKLKRDLGTAIVMITHDLGVVAEVCERVVVMYAGRKVEEAPVERLFESPLHPYTRGLMASMPVLDTAGGAHRSPRHRLAEIPGMVPSLKTRMRGCSFAPRCARATPVCREQTPALAHGGDGHSVACWHAGEGS